MLLGHRRGQRVGGHRRICSGERVILDVQRAVGAARQRLANHLLDAGWSGRADHDLAAQLLTEPQRFLERIGVRLVHLEAGVLLADPGLVVGETRLPLARGDLLDADGDLHTLGSRLSTLDSGLVEIPKTKAKSAYPSYFLNSNAAFVPPKPNEFDSA